MFTKEQQQTIADRINEIEAKTSSNLHVHVRKKCKKNALEDATKFFAKNKMHHTQHRNAVLIFIGETSRRFAVLGDDAVHAKVQQAFWDNSRDIILKHFKQADFIGGILAALDEIGPRLIKHFPKCDDHAHDKEQNVMGDVSAD